MAEYLSELLERTGGRPWRVHLQRDDESEFSIPDDETPDPEPEPAPTEASAGEVAAVRALAGHFEREKQAADRVALIEEFCSVHGINGFARKVVRVKGESSIDERASAWAAAGKPKPGGCTPLFPRGRRK